VVLKISAKQRETLLSGRFEKKQVSRSR